MAAQINDNETVTLKEALHRFVEVYLQGRQPDIDEFVQQYPQHEAQLRKRIQDLREIDTLFDSIFQTEGSELADEIAGQDLVGRKIGNFEIEKVIGQGGMGIVYLARDTKLKRSVAVKSLPPTLTTDSDSLTRFRREAEILASLNHPNIAVIHEIIEQDTGASYLVLEYVPGETLTERMAREPLKLEEALSIGQQVAEAISAAHKKSIVHRDLKPGNIKITPEGRVKVLDFGLAKSSSKEDIKSDITSTEFGRVIGTPAYMSPEQAGSKDADYRTDIWSFGCILYQMQTGRLPFEGETATDTLASIIEREPDWNLLPQETPANIRILLQRCLEKDPDRRLGDIAEAATEISEVVSKPATAPTMKLQRMTMIIGVMAIGIILSGIALKFIPKRELRNSSKEIRLVVLPFENLSSTEDEYFSDGITDEITVRLASIHDLGVISRQSAMQYKKSEKNTRQIAEELSVDYILEGTIQCERPSDPNSRVKIRPQLIRVADDTHVWAEIYEDDMSQIFRLQSDVAERTVRALDITLFDAERQTLRSKPTKNMEAYVYYLRGNDYSSRLYQNQNDLMIAIDMYEKATELDDKFALAHAWLSHAYSGMYWFHGRSEEHRALAWKESEKALELDPELPEAHWARGVCYYWGRLDHDNAFKELEIALKRQPKNSRILATIGHIQRRQGNCLEALANYKGALELNPLSIPRAGDLAGTLGHLRRYTEAEYYYDRVISLAPDEPALYCWKAYLYLAWKGSTSEARKVLDKASQYISLDNERIVQTLFRLDVLDREYEAALNRLALESPTTDNSKIRNAMQFAEIYRYMGNKESAEGYYKQANSILESKVKEHPKNGYYHSMLGITYAGLGLEEEAIHEAKLGVELVPYDKDSQSHISGSRDIALVYLMVGQYDAAVDKIEYMLSKPGGLSIPLLKIDPAWDPLRNHPRFQKLIEQGK